ncbi:MAG: nicotinate (nicotinamide) nucleotide adenylyltransferase [Acidobacteria bacterium]|nr:nicotinate (nicotinamide) nucleotide adenylyltransferase [Acidobacteriota bacterium]
MKIGLFGGSFDPVHRGHVEAAAAARRALGLDRVELVVTGRPPHKEGPRSAPALARYVMAELAVLDHPDLAVSVVELDETRKSYTIDTLELRRRELPDAEIWWILGADAFAELHTWRRFRAILASFPVAVLARPGFDRRELLAGLDAELARLVSGSRVEWVENPLVDASSTRLREVLASGGRPPEDRLDPRVLRFVDKYRLYR